MIYAILDSEGKCINRTVWDGISPWQPPEGCTAVLDNEGIYQIESPVQPVVEPAPTPVDDILLSLTDEQKQQLIALLGG